MILEVLLWVHLPRWHEEWLLGGWARWHCGGQGVPLPAAHGAHEQGGASQRQLQGVHPALARWLGGGAEDEVGHGERLHQGADGLAFRALQNGLLAWFEV